MRVFLLLFLSGCFWVTEAEREARWDLDGDGLPRPLDCDDDDPDAQGMTWYADADGDSYGDPASATQECEPGEGFVLDGTDCDDTNAAVFPGAPELCNGADDDCSGAADDASGLMSTWYTDSDGDSFGDPSAPVSACDQPPGTVANADDCDDGTGSVAPDAPELCNGVDDDCDGLFDLDDPDLDPAPFTWFFDGDLDGFGTELDTATGCTPPTGYVAEGGDCNDDNDAVHPGLLTDDCLTVDDDNCDTVTNPPGSANGTLAWPDADQDGFGDPTQPLDACVPPQGYVSNGLDCDDSDGCTFIGAVEVCNGGIDNDCANNGDDGCVAADTADTGACP